MCIFTVNATSSFMFSCNISLLPSFFHSHVIMTVISHKCCSFGIADHKSSLYIQPNLLVVVKRECVSFLHNLSHTSKGVDC